MHCDKINLKETGYFSQLLLDYLDAKPGLSPFYHAAPSVDSFKKVIEGREFDPGKRAVLAEVLREQYSGLAMKNEVSENITGLKDPKTFTVTTGHQLNIFTGPLFFIFKIITVINTCRKLKEAYPEYSFVPVYWMASEDHDLDEIRSFTLFGKTYSWETDQKGPVGRMDPASIKPLFKELPESMPLFEKAYTENSTLAGAVRAYVDELFGREGLVVLDADNFRLKEQLSQVIKDDLVNHHANDIVESTSSRLAEMGYNTQVYPRAINLFYMEKDSRERIVHEEGTYQLADSGRSFSAAEMLSLVQEKPDHFSPNVILRPVYQEIILPNIAYVGGPAEVAYWLQLKAVFDHYKVFFPVIMPRNFGMVIGKGLVRKLSKLTVDSRDLFLDFMDLKKKYLQDQAAYSFSLDPERKVFSEVFKSIKNKSQAIDKSLEGFIGSEEARLMKSLENIEKRLSKAEEAKQETSVNQLKSLKDKLFPEGKLQEREENVMSFLLNDPAFISAIISIFEPFDFRFHVFFEEG